MSLRKEPKELNKRNKSQFKIGICAIVKNEDEYIEEWVAFHLAVGVEFILIIDNGESSNLARILFNYVDEGFVEIRKFRGRHKAQRTAYNRGIRLMRKKVCWLALIDVDEFLFPAEEDSLQTVLRDFSAHPAVAVNWVSFGSGGQLAKKDGWVIERFTERGPLDHLAPSLAEFSSVTEGEKDRSDIVVNCHVKCIVNPRRTKYFRTAHNFRYQGGDVAVNEIFEPVDGPMSQRVSVSRIRINHYWSKSLQELRAKIEKGRVSQNERGANSGYDWSYAILRDRAATGVEDRSILRFLGEARSISEKYSNHTSQEAKSTYLFPSLPGESAQVIRAFRRWFRRLVRKAQVKN